jgi:hypothetical protein
MRFRVYARGGYEERHPGEREKGPKKIILKKGVIKKR